MVNLVSPGVSVSVIDESFYVGAGQGTVPMIFITTRESKPTPDGSGVAPGTLPENANKLYLISSQRELIQTFGVPEFRNVAGAGQNGNALNEYGLLAAHSYLGLANRAYIMRADVNLSELEPLVNPPESDPVDLTYWAQLNGLIPGLFVSENGSPWAPQPVKIYEGVITPGVSLPSSGFSTGDIVLAVNQLGNFQFFVREENPVTSIVDWEPFGVNHIGPHTDVPDLAAGAAEYWFKTTTPNQGANLPVRVFDASISRFLEAGTVRFAEDANDFYARFFGGSGTDVPAGTLAALYGEDESVGAPPGTLATTALSYGLFWHNGESQVRAGGRVFDPTSSITADGDLVINGVAVALGQSVILAQDQDDFSAFSAGTLYEVGDRIVLDGDVVLRVDAVAGGGEVTEFTVISASGFVTGASGTLTQQVVDPGPGSAGNGDNFTLDWEASNVEYSLEAIVNAVNSTTISGVVASSENGEFTLINTEGLDLDVEFDNGLTGDLIAEGLYSNFILISDAAPAYRASTTQPGRGPRDGVLWYDPAFEVDLLVRNGNSWVELADENNVMFVTPTEPSERENGDPLSDGDVWVSTLGTLEYPTIYRYRAGIQQAWILVDNSDQTTPDGVIFADARPDPDYVRFGSVPEGQFNGDVFGNPDLDPDRPNPLLYPQGMLLWNTRYSSRNVKRWVDNFVAKGIDLGEGRWVSVSGTTQDGQLLTGQAAVRRTVEIALGSTIVSNDEIRAESIFYNLISAPGFPELSDELVALNIDRRETAFILADAPFDLTPDSTSLQEWSQSIPVNSENIAYYYPGSALTTNLDGREVVVPPSHMTLRTVAFNDLVAYPWFAPAGFQRGRVNNATQVGFVDSEGEFVPVTLNQGQRDVLYINNVNPIVFAPNRGLTVFGQKTRYPLDSALDRVNVARLINYIRFQSERIAEPFLFEPNDTQTRIAVKDRFDSFLDELITLRGLFDFLVVVDETNNTPARIDRNELWIDIAIAPTKAVEFIYIPIRVRNTGADLTI